MDRESLVNPVVPGPVAAMQDPARLESEYNLRARHPDHPEIFDRWRTASDLVQRIEPRRLDVHYGDGPDETLDIFLTPRSGAPVMLYIHGGYWRSLDKADQSFIAPTFTAEGALVVMPNYTLCPAVGIEEIALQMTRALAWTYRHAGLYGGDPDRLYVVGHSAGGHLAAMMLSCRWKDVGSDLPAQLVAGACSISGLFDLEPLRLSPFVQCDLQLTPASVRRLSPAFFPRPRRPLHVAVGGAETNEFQRQSALIRAQWGPTSVPVCETIAGFHHYSILHDLADARGRTHAIAARMLGLESGALRSKLSGG
jgi:arylformamidase